MNMLHTMMFVCVLMANIRCGIASDLSVQISAHSRSVAFGDPLYIEVTILNSGLEAVAAPKPALDLNTFAFRIRKPTTDTMMTVPGTSGGGGFFGIAGTQWYRPGKPVKHYWYIFLPDVRWSTHPFWKPLGGGVAVHVWGSYGLDRALSLRSNSIEVLLTQRNDAQTHVFQHSGSTGKIEVWERGPLGADFGLRFLEPLVRDQVLEARRIFKTGEIADLLELTLQMQDIYALKPEAREASNAKLVAWLKKQADIKRQALAIEARGIAEGNNMRSTQQALEELISDAAFMSDKSAAPEKSR